MSLDLPELEMCLDDEAHSLIVVYEQHSHR